MGQESIKVYFVSGHSFAGKDAYHGTVVYTNSAGQQFFAAGDMGNQLMSEAQRTSAVNAFLAEKAVFLGPGHASPFGNLVTVQGSITNPSLATYVSKWITNAGTVDTLATGADLHNEWGFISSTMTQINDRQFQYAPATQNSGSALCTALSAASLLTFSRLTGDFSPTGNHWLPGCEYILPTSYTTSTRYGSTSFGFDGNGAETATVVQSDSANTIHDTIVIGNGTNASYEELVIPTTSTPFVDISGVGLVAYLSNAYIDVVAGTVASIIGNGNYASIDDMATIVAVGNDNQFEIGESNVTTLTGSRNMLDMWGQRETVSLNQYNIPYDPFVNFTDASDNTIEGLYAIVYGDPKHPRTPVEPSVGKSAIPLQATMNEVSIATDTAAASMIAELRDSAGTGIRLWERSVGPAEETDTINNMIDFVGIHSMSREMMY